MLTIILQLRMEKFEMGIDTRLAKMETMLATLLPAGDGSAR